MFSDAHYFSVLYEIAATLNKEFSLHAALRKSLEKTVDLLELETGWIWLLQGEQSVYLAASYHLPPALKEHPERLSGWCYCMERYFTNRIDQALNISEIVCSRLKNIQSGTNDLKFHATIPIAIGEQKVGLINLLSRESQELDERQLAILNTIGELLGIAIQRTRLQDTNASNPLGSMLDVLKKVFTFRLNAINATLEKMSQAEASTDFAQLRIFTREALSDVRYLSRQLEHILNEAPVASSSHTASSLHFPTSALTPRELELLPLIKKGLTNKQIGEMLFISERTVKFHVTSILSKLFARTRTEAVDIAQKRGLLEG